jgi:hypothetical protein
MCTLPVSDPVSHHNKMRSTVNAFTISALVASDAPDFGVLVVWLGIGVVGFVLGAVLLSISLRRAQRRPVAAMSRDAVPAASSELIAA